jgi:hypothetical protein
MTRPLLGNDLLFSIRGNPGHSAARVGRPEGSIRFGQNTFRTLQIAADVPDRRLLNLKIQDRIMYQSIFSQELEELCEFSH